MRETLVSSVFQLGVSIWHAMVVQLVCCEEAIRLAPKDLHHYHCMFCPRCPDFFGLDICPRKGNVGILFNSWDWPTVRLAQAFPAAAVPPCGRQLCTIILCVA